jgi:hypothetical protein
VLVLVPVGDFKYWVSALFLIWIDHTLPSFRTVNQVLAVELFESKSTPYFGNFSASFFTSEFVVWIFVGVHCFTP